MLISPTSVNDGKVSHSHKEGQEVHQSKLSKQVCKNDGVHRDTSHQTLFSKDNRRIAHSQTHHKNKPGKQIEYFFLFAIHMLCDILENIYSS